MKSVPTGILKSQEVVVLLFHILSSGIAVYFFQEQIYGLEKWWKVCEGKEDKHLCIL